MSNHQGGTCRPNHGKAAMDDNKLLPKANWQTQQRGSNDSEYQIYLSCANDGAGNDITNGQPLKSYEEWLAS